jgi:hypothetical protein
MDWVGYPRGRVKRRPVADGGFEVARNASTRALVAKDLQCSRPPTAQRT